MYTATYLSPMIPSFNIEGTMQFFTELLAFGIEMHTPQYVILSKNKLTIHILHAGTDIGQMEFYLEVDDIETVWAHIKDKIEGLNVRPPFDREYGMREFHIEVPHTKTLLFVGQVLV